MTIPRVQSEIIIRDADLDDRDFVITTVRRLATYGPPPWRTFDEIVAREQRALHAFFDRPEPGAAVLIAERNGEERLGYAYLEVREDYFTGDQCGHISSVAVIERVDRQGVGSALMRAAEEWARSKGFCHLTLNVFAANYRAREI